MLGHLDPVFLSILDETCERLRTVFQTTNQVTLPISGTGSAGMEACLTNLIDPGDVVVVASNGLFGERMAEIARRCGGAVTIVRSAWGQPIDPSQVLAAHPAPKIIAAVHAETSTGVCNDIAAVAAGKGDAILVADCVTSLGGIQVEIDAWAIDASYSCSQKCLGVAPGLAPLTVSERARAGFTSHPRSWYLDLEQLAAYASSPERRYHHTAPVAMITALHAGLGALLEEGLDASLARHASCGQQLQDGLETLGLELFAAKGSRLPQCTTVVVPDGVDAHAIRRQLLERYGIEIGAGVGEYANRLWRIGTMGHNARPANVVLLLAALQELLGR
jgi:alanine-glyoxylate transaminase/serine-glyoxylate transaminase/serine-pyruvate transaminase